MAGEASSTQVVVADHAEAAPNACRVHCANVAKCLSTHVTLGRKPTRIGTSSALSLLVRLQVC